MDKNLCLWKKFDSQEVVCLCPGSISGANIMGYLSRGWSVEYHICFYIPKCSSWSVVLKSSVCHLGKPCITPVFKMAFKMASIS